MRFRPANIRLINRRQKLLWLLLALSSKNKNNPTGVRRLTGSLHIRDAHLLGEYYPRSMHALGCWHQLRLGGCRLLTEEIAMMTIVAV